METTKYIGSWRVTDNEVVDGIVTFTLENGMKQTATVEQFMAMVADEVYDDGMISMRKWEPTIVKMIQIATDEGATVQDFEWLQDRISETVGKNYTKAMSESLGVAFPKQVTLKKIDEILKTE